MQGSMPDFKLKRAAFVQEYLVDLNATAAAIRAGYSEVSAKNIGYTISNTPEVKAAIQAAMDERAARVGLSQDWIVSRLMLVADSKLRDAFNEAGELLKPHEWDAKTSYAMASVEVDTVSAGAGAVTHVAKLKTRDALKALELLGRHMNMFKDQVEVTGKVTLQSLVEASMAKQDEKPAELAKSSE